jgi:uncharacterized protein YndB with AHSA1/START domain
MSTSEESRSVVVERDLPHAPSKVWRALTESALIDDWLMTNDFVPVVGHKFQLRTDPMPHWNGVLDCEVLEVVPHRRLVYAWCSSGAEAAEGLKTVVEWTLSPSATGTLLRMEQSGFLGKDENNRRGAEYGWQKYFGKLQDLVGVL